jgi:hypothetical protein
MVNKGIGAKLTAVTIHNSCLLWLSIGVSPLVPGKQAAGLRVRSGRKSRFAGAVPMGRVAQRPEAGH